MCRQITVSVCITEGGSIGDRSRWKKEGLLFVLLFESVELLCYSTLTMIGTIGGNARYYRWTRCPAALPVIIPYIDLGL